MLSLESEIETTSTVNVLLLPPFTNDELKMKVSELKSLLMERRLRSVGLKNALVHGLSENHKSLATLLSHDELQAPEGFHVTSRWKQLKAQLEPANEALSRFRNSTQMGIATSMKKHDHVER